jgi:hypothetical protein
MSRDSTSLALRSRMALSLWPAIDFGKPALKKQHLDSLSGYNRSKSAVKMMGGTGRGGPRLVRDST